MTMIENNNSSHKDYFYDDGCEYSKSCLQCPLVLCKYDDPILDNSKSKNNRNMIISNMKKTNMTNKEIAKTLNISTRTVHRVLNQNNQQDQKFVLELKNQNIIKKSQLISMRN
ncbi:MAG: HTH domain-containing protein [SAR202 cluster bacterium]|nr:HTH domain-containing protein [SAR202 cluster bacterium]|tara:strand:+ start:243 stop:581 length:339 start_codon:yes stop_codon:yes gene_type:complete